LLEKTGRKKARPRSRDVQDGGKGAPSLKEKGLVREKYEKLLLSYFPCKKGPIFFFGGGEENALAADSGRRKKPLMGSILRGDFCQGNSITGAPGGGSLLKGGWVVWEEKSGGRLGNTSIEGGAGFPPNRDT